MNLQNLIFIFCFAFTFSISGLYSEVIYLKPKIILNKSKLFLSDLTKLDRSKDREIFSNLREVKKLSKLELSEILKDEFEIRGTDCILIPLFISYDNSEIKESLEKELNLQDKNLRISYLGDEILLPESNLDVKWNLQNAKSNSGQKLISLDLFFEKEKIHSYRLKFLFEEKKTFYFTKSEIPKGKIISKEDVFEKEIYSSDSKKPIPLESILEHQSLTTLSPNTLIEKKHLNHTKLVERGSEVDIVFLKGNLFVKGRGIAKNSANEGELVKVSSISNHQLISTRAMEKGVVIVE